MGTSNQTEKVIKNTKKSAISNHLFLYVDILFSDFNNNKLLIKERLLIKCDQPVLNRKKKSFPLDVSDDSLSLFFLENHCIKYVRVRSFLVRIFPHSDWIRTRITLNMDTFHAVSTISFQYLIEKIICELIEWIDHLICYNISFQNVFVVKEPVTRSWVTFDLMFTCRSSYRRCSVFLEISQNSQENTCARVSFLIKLQKINF